MSMPSSDINRCQTHVACLIGITVASRSSHWAWILLGGVKRLRSLGNGKGVVLIYPGSSELNSMWALDHAQTMSLRLLFLSRRTLKLPMFCTSSAFALSSLRNANYKLQAIRQRYRLVAYAGERARPCCRQPPYCSICSHSHRA
jgi:hypothetical protein